MNFKLFPVTSTNIFPMANTTLGGQLVTEYNLKSRESVYADENVKYRSGPSYVHAEEDFAIQALGDSVNYFPNRVANTTSVIEMLPGRGVIDGHYIESLTSIAIDLVAENAAIIDAQGTPLTGNLAIGLKVEYSTEATMVGSIVAETDVDEHGDPLPVPVYAGIQIVILPVDEFHVPGEVFELDGEEINTGLEENMSYVTAHIRLATFNFSNGNISNIHNMYPEKCRMIPASRVGNLTAAISDEFVKKTGLNPQRLYTFAGKGTDPVIGQDTWCDSTDALMLWDADVHYPRTEVEYHSTILNRAPKFKAQSDGSIQFIIPHKQIDGKDPVSRSQYAPVVLSLPKADFGTDAPGTVTPEYTRSVKAITSRIEEFYHLTNGRQRAFIPELNDTSELPPINYDWNDGDYILVGRDNTAISSVNDSTVIAAPSTLYVVRAGTVTAVGAGERALPSGVELYRMEGDSELNPNIPPTSTAWWNLEELNLRGKKNQDYLTLVYTAHDTNPPYETTVVNYYFKVTEVVTPSDRIYSEPIFLTGQTAFAETSLVGGFLNIDTSEVDQGYVYLDNDGHLRLLDYEILRTGTLAYQLGEDFTVPSGLTIDQIQAYLNEYVNQRIAFPNATQIQNASNPNVINITITIPSDSDGGTLDIFDIDSRFDTAINLNIFGNADSNVTINISDCQKVRINSNIGGTPVVNLYRSCLYYDSAVLDQLNIIRDMTLWYSKFESSDPDLVVQGMTVSLSPQAAYSALDTITLTPADIEYWSLEAPNDNHIDIALKTLTFGSNGLITGCGILIRNNSASNVITGKSLLHTEFTLPNNNSFSYPTSKLRNHIIVTGDFISAYQISSPTGYMIQDTKFTAKTQCFVADGNGGYSTEPGELAVIVDAYTMSIVDNVDISCWDTYTYHYFDGVVTV